MALNDTYMLTVIGQAGGQDHLHTLHFRDSGVVNPAAALASSWRTNCENAYRALFPTMDPVEQLLRVQHICASGPAEATYEVAVPGAAQIGFRTVASNRSPPFMAALFKVRTALAGKRRQGRFFVGGLLDSDHDLSTMSAAYIVLMQAYIDVLKAAYVTPATPAFRLVVHSRKDVEENPTIACQQCSTPVTDITASGVPTTMRSRKLGHGL